MRKAQAALAAILVSTIALPASAPAQTPDPKEAVIAASVSFAIAYRVWFWEKRCQALTPDKHSQYEKSIINGLKRLREAADAMLVDGATSGSESVNSDPAYADCKGAETEGLAEFGLEQMLAAEASLASLPPGYHLTITP